jgi:hypothetical protein
MKGAYQPSIALRAIANIVNNFCDVVKSFSDVANRRLATFNERCCERVANMFRACCERGYVEHPTSGVFLPPPPHVVTMLRLCCDHVATMLRPYCDLCCVQHPTSGALPPLLLDTTPNITCLQHRNSTSATFAKSQWNIKMHMSQHVRVADETRETKCCNIIKTMTHVACNIQHQELPLLLDTQTSHVCNKETQHPQH